MKTIAGNNKISKRQAYRLFFMDMLGPLSLLVPKAVAGRAGIGGVITILLGGALTLWCLQITLRACEKCEWTNRLLGIFLGIMGLLTAGIAAYYFARLMKETLVRDLSYGLVLGLILFLSGYLVTPQQSEDGVQDIVERRARVYELLFVPVVFGLLLAFVLALRDVHPIYLYNAGVPKFTGMVEGAYLMFLCQGGILYLPLFRGCVDTDNKGFATAIRGSFFTALALVLLLYVILVGNFGGPALAKMDYPAVILMSNIQFQGTFVKRLDAIMVGIWFFMLYAVLNVNIFMARQIFSVGVSKQQDSQQQQVGRKRWQQIGMTVIVLLVIFIEAMWMKESEDIRNIIKIIYFAVVGPLIILIPLLLLAGCRAKELEDRVFPLAVYVQHKAGVDGTPQIGVELQLPKLKTEPDAAELAGPDMTEERYGRDFVSALLQCEQFMDTEPDYNHLKVIVLDQEFVEDKKQMEWLLNYVRQETTFPRNTYVCIANDMDALMSFEGETEDMGSYLERMLEKYAKDTGEELPTLGHMADEQINRYEKIGLPVIYMNESSISVNTSSGKEG